MHYASKKKLVAIIAIAVLFTFSGNSPISLAAVDRNKSVPTNVIMMIMDGTNASATTLARWYKGENLAIDEILVGGVRTYSADSAITDSAPAATALATGYKSNNKVVGLLPKVINTPSVTPMEPNNVYRPVANVLEGAKVKGKATGIVSTSEIQHATPAGFSAHTTHRDNYEDIAEQQVYQGIDVVLGGGKKFLGANNARNERLDRENLLEVIRESGYDFVETKEELLRSTSYKIWGAFAPYALAFDFDRQVWKRNEPSLAEMTKKAIDTLSKHEKGFFLFVEGSKIDWAAHDNDTIGIVSDILAFDDAVREALTFAKGNEHTMVIVVSDHGTSGMTLGNENTSSHYGEISVSSFIHPLKKATMTLEGALMQLKTDRSNMREVAALYGLDTLTTAEIQKLKKSNTLKADMAHMLAERAQIGYTTFGHTGEDVFLYAYGPSIPFGLVENTEIAKIIATFLGFDLDAVTKKLFVNAKEVFEKKGYKTWIEKKNKYNPVFIAEKDHIKMEFPVNKNIVHITEKNVSYNETLEGVTVYNGIEFYVPEAAGNVAK